MMSPILAEPALISDMAVIMDCICWLQVSTFFSASRERIFAFEALSAVSRTCSETPAMLAVSSSNTLAWSIVLFAKFLAPCEVPSEWSATRSAALFIWAIVSLREPTMVSMDSFKLTKSPVKSASVCISRFPADSCASTRVMSEIYKFRLCMVSLRLLERMASSFPVFRTSTGVCKSPSASFTSRSVTESTGLMISLICRFISTILKDKRRMPMALLTMTETRTMDVNSLCGAVIISRQSSWPVTGQYAANMRFPLFQ